MGLNVYFDSEDADIYEKEVQTAEKRLIKMKQHQADLFAQVELLRRDVDKHQEQQQDYKRGRHVNKTLFNQLD